MTFSFLEKTDWKSAADRHGALQSTVLDLPVNNASDEDY